ncbi:E3 ubiquitin ligase [Blastocladiella emersonii ATCC 22665]|nr:E3 ubiquitin ligase [Blastocladiella emersonii ATCC 22665]
MNSASPEPEPARPTSALAALASGDTDAESTATRGALEIRAGRAPSPVLSSSSSDDEADDDDTQAVASPAHPPAARPTVDEEEESDELEVIDSTPPPPSATGVTKHRTSAPRPRPTTAAAPAETHVPVNYPPALIARKVHSSVTCLICRELFTRPYVLACGHAFCFGCIAYWLEQSKRRCPTCRARVFRRPGFCFALAEIVEVLGGTRVGSIEGDVGVVEHESDAWEKLFGREVAAGVVADVEDGVRRCYNCHWEIVGTDCAHCGMQYDDDDFLATDALVDKADGSTDGGDVTSDDDDDESIGHSDSDESASNSDVILNELDDAASSDGDPRESRRARKRRRRAEARADHDLDAEDPDSDDLAFVAPDHEEIVFDTDAEDDLANELAAADRAADAERRERRRREREARIARRKRVRLPSSDDEEEVVGDEERPKKRSRHHHHRRRIMADDDDDEEEDIDAHTPQRHPSSPVLAKLAFSSASEDEGHPPPAVAFSSGDEEDEEEVKPASSRKAKASVVVLSSDLDGESDAPAAAASPGKAKHAVTVDLVSDGASGDDDGWEEVDAESGDEVEATEAAPHRRRRDRDREDNEDSGSSRSESLASGSDEEDEDDDDEDEMETDEEPRRRGRHHHHRSRRDRDRDRVAHRAAAGRRVSTSKRRAR